MSRQASRILIEIYSVDTDYQSISDQIESLNNVLRFSSFFNPRYMVENVLSIYFKSYCSTQN